MKHKFCFQRSVRIAILAVCYAVAVSAAAQERKTTLGSATMREANLRAPELYSDQLKLTIVLANLPGATDAGSTWETSYEIYFISESAYYSVIDHLPPGGHSLEPTLFPQKVLLAEGRFKKDKLSSSAARTEIREDIALRSKVADREKTKFGRLMTAYSVKVYDARLKMSLYHLGLFVTYVFEKASGAVTPRKTLYLGFSVTPQGELSYSQQPISQ